MTLRLTEVWTPKTTFGRSERYDNVKCFRIVYQHENNKSYWVFITQRDGKEFAVEYNPKSEIICCWED